MIYKKKTLARRTAEERTTVAHEDIQEAAETSEMMPSSCEICHLGGNSALKGCLRHGEKLPLSVTNVLHHT